MQINGLVDYQEPKRIDYELVNRLCKKHKAALTRAKKKGPQAVILAVHAFFVDFGTAEQPLPDAWHTWTVAFDDAVFTIRTRGGDFDPGDPADAKILNAVRQVEAWR